MIKYYKCDRCNRCFAVAENDLVIQCIQCDRFTKVFEITSIEFDNYLKERDKESKEDE